MGGIRGTYRDSEVLKSLCSDIQDGYPSWIEQNLDGRHKRDINIEILKC